MPRVSVILPVFNAGQYLSIALDSVLSQTFRDFELIAIDDGSTDGSLNLLQELAKSDSRIRVITRPNKGLVATLNEGITLSKGEYLARMDADDICRPERFEKQVAYMDINPDCIALGTRVLLIDSEGCPIMDFALERDHREIDSAHLAGKGGAVVHPAVIMRKEAVLRIDGYRAEYKHAEDLDLFLRLAEIGRLSNLPDVLLEYRQHLTSIGYTQRPLQQQAADAAIADAYRRRKISPESKMDNTIPLVKTSSIVEIYVKWAWWALSAGNITTARKYAFKAFKFNPLNIKNLRLLACVIRGR